MGELLARATFDRVVAAFSNGSGLYMEAVPPAATMLPADIFAAGAIAAQQALTDHLRKLQDTGLSALSGSDPVTAALVTLLVAGLIIGGIGVGILIECDNAQNQGKQPPGGKDLCAIGEILVYLAMLILEMTALLSGGAIQAIAWLAIGGLLPELVANFYQIESNFTPGMAPTQQ